MQLAGMLGELFAVLNGWYVLAILTPNLTYRIKPNMALRVWTDLRTKDLNMVLRVISG
jgi:hypothetical protein